MGLVASRQFGCVTREQLRLLGLSDSAIATRVRRCQLVRVHRGVYVVGHRARTDHQREMAAVLACGPRAVLSRRSAAAAWELLAADDAPVDVTVPGPARRGRPGVVVHRSRLLVPDVMIRHSMPVTAVARTLIDLAPALPELELERAVEGARRRRLITTGSLEAALGRAGRRRGVGLVRRLLTRADGPALTRSEAEARALGLFRAAHLSEPECNVRVLRYEVDFLWRAQRVVVEIDGYAFHRGRRAFEDDRARDAELGAAGYRVLRFTWRQLVEKPELVVARLAQALVRRL